MSSKNYAVLSEDLSITDRKTMRLRALASGVVRSIALGIGVWDRSEIPGADPAFPQQPSLDSTMKFLAAGGWPRSLDVLDFQPILHAGTALDRWQTAPLLVAGGEYSCFQAIPAPAIALRIKKLVVWYRVQIETIPAPVSRMLFRRNGAAGITQAEFDLEQLVTGQKLDAYFSEPVIWDNNTAYAINVIARTATLVAANIVLGNFVFEPAGTTNA